MVEGFGFRGFAAGCEVHRAGMPFDGRIFYSLAEVFTFLLGDWGT